MNAAEFRRIDMFCDYEAEWPLWDGGMITPSSLGLSTALTLKLRVWTDYYLEHARVNQGWLVSKDRDAEWYAEGRRLSEHLARELNDKVEIHYTGT
ncbi:hypothetical protein EDF64_11573 [Curtobacterium flaccumfaciens]|uniref:Uncharacterized protein n=1 Tax=Curtobacterium flaccumfaciens TaxID=2035 RepID=A0A4R6DCM1_9MICO|nr:hypothetical protein [Curtobacterium flaccumfaciens]TDN41884.1 hypothetical protein EDF64_11573 [Curtobacterium flaccumfaciens]